MMAIGSGGPDRPEGGAMAVKLPVIEFEDGTTLREESKDLAARIRAGQLSGPGA